MENEYKPPPKKPAGVAFLLACLGLFFLNCAIGLLASNTASGLGWMFIIIGAALMVLAVFWGAERI